MEVPFVDLKLQYSLIKTEIDAAIRDVLDSALFIMGPHVEEFERVFAAINGVGHCIGTGSGTEALHLALWALGVGPGDSVILPVNTFIATAEAVSLCGAEPVFVDCDDHFNIDADAVRDVIENEPGGARGAARRIRAIVPVHLYGQPADMQAMLDLARKHEVSVVEDACQAHLARWQDRDGVWRAAGAAGVVGAFSFFPGKNLGAYGEAGAVIASDDDLYERMLQLHNHGSVIRYEHARPGHNYRMEAIQGAVLSAKLGHIAEWTKRRQEHAELYGALLGDIEEVTTPAVKAGRTHVFHLYVVRVDPDVRAGLVEYLRAQGIATGLHYPTPLHLQKAYAHLGYGAGSFPKAERFSREILSLPMFPELTGAQIEHVAASIKAFFGREVRRA